MKKMKKLAALLLSLCMVLAVTACGGDTSGSEDDGTETYTFQVGHVVTTDHSYNLGLQKFG